MPRYGSPNGSPPCGPHSYVWPGLCVYVGCHPLAPLPTAHCLPRFCVGSALHRGKPSMQRRTNAETTNINAEPTHHPICENYVAPLLLFSVLSHCALLRKRSYWSPYTNCYPTEPRLLCGWSDGLEWTSRCAASDGSGPLCFISLWP